jgi:hypothetical protein
MLIKPGSKSVVLAALLATSAALAQSTYDQGQQALREQRWLEAAELFELYWQSGEPQADAAMYWQAHALYKAGRHAAAQSQLRLLERKYPDSRWVKEAQALMIEYQDTLDPSGLDAELQMFALARLMERDPERALPLVLQFLRSEDARAVRNDALFVLGMSDYPQARQAIAEIALDSDDPELQANAISILGTAADDASLALLADLYTGSTDPRVRQAVIHAYIGSDDARPLVEILQSETDPELQREIIHALGAMDATDELRTLYPGLDNEAARVAAIEAFMIAGDTGMLRQVLETESDPELRAAAIQGIGIEGGEDAAEMLGSIYDQATSEEEKRAVLEALYTLDSGQDLALKILRTETEPELQREAIQALGVMGAVDALADLYPTIDSVENRKAVLESLAIAGDASGIHGILQAERNPELRAAAIQALAISGDQVSSELLVSMYAGASREEKVAIGENMLILDDAEGLIGLLRQESDPELRRELLHLLAAMDSEAADDYLFELLERD